MLLKNIPLKKLAKLALVTAFSLLMGWHATSQAAPEYDPLYDKERVIFFQVVNVSADDVLNLRKFPNYRSRKVGKIPANQECVAYLNEIRQKRYHKYSRKWVKVSHKGVQGWANLRYLRQTEWGCGTFYQIFNVPDHLNLRQSPDHRSQKLGEIPADEQECIIALDEVEVPNKKWVLLQYAGVKGWVNSRYLKKIDVDECDV
jgi:uncharacterized protein YgiM (DUF1202 family)